jgi:hypothetical protein
MNGKIFIHLSSEYSAGPSAICIYFNNRKNTSQLATWLKLRPNRYRQGFVLGTISLGPMFLVCSVINIT